MLGIAQGINIIDLSIDEPRKLSFRTIAIPSEMTVVNNTVVIAKKKLLYRAI